MRTKKDILDGMNNIEFLLRCKSEFKFFCEKMLSFASDVSPIDM